MDNDNAGLLPVDSGTYGSEVFSLNLFEFDAKVVLLRVILNGN